MRQLLVSIWFIFVVQKVYGQPDVTITDIDMTQTKLGLNTTSVAVQSCLSKPSALGSSDERTLILNFYEGSVGKIWGVNMGTPSSPKSNTVLIPFGSPYESALLSCKNGNFGIIATGKLMVSSMYNTEVRPSYTFDNIGLVSGGDLEFFYSRALQAGSSYTTLQWPNNTPGPYFQLSTAGDETLTPVISDVQDQIRLGSFSSDGQTTTLSLLSYDTISNTIATSFEFVFPFGFVSRPTSKMIEYGTKLYLGIATEQNFYLYNVNSPIVYLNLTKTVVFFDFVGIGPDLDWLVVVGLESNGNLFAYIWDSITGNGVEKLLTTFSDAISNNPITLNQHFVNTTVRLTYVQQTSIYGKFIEVNTTRDIIVASPIISSPISDVVPIPSQNNVNISVSANDTLVITESITIDNLEVLSDSILQVNEGAVITVTGCATLNGTLKVLLSNGTISNALNNEIDVLLMNISCRSGEFNDIQVISSYNLENCSTLISTPQYKPLTVSVLILVDDSDCGTSSSFDETALIIGVCIGGGAVLIVGILLLAFYFSPLRDKVFPYAKRYKR